MTMNIERIREELCHTLRNGDILTTTVRSVTTATDICSAMASQTVFNLTHTGVKNIRSCTVNSVAKYLFRDYTVNWATGVLTLLTGAGVGEAVVIQYDYSSVADKIYPDMPRVDLTLTSFPRVGIELVSINTEPLGLGGTTHISDIVLDIIAWVPVNKSATESNVGGTADLSDLIKNIRDVIRTNAKSFYNFTFITPTGSNPITASTNNKIIQQSMTFHIKFLTE